jgi:hypothetical protein
MVGGTIDADHLTAHWDEALRLAVSVGSGHATASGMLRRLAAYPRQNGLAVALREIGRVERTLFAPDWMRDPGLRRRANAGLNKGEARNALARAAAPRRAARMGAYQPHRQLHLDAGCSACTRPTQTAARAALAARSMSSRPVRANRTLRALSCRDP